MFKIYKETYTRDRLVFVTGTFNVVVLDYELFCMSWHRVYYVEGLLLRPCTRGAIERYYAIRTENV